MTKNIIISFLSLVTFCVTPLFAQESCYEQYLREHNKKILTAEDADDSYDELKKTVLAKQMYGDSYLLMVDTVAQRAVITKVDGTYVADVHLVLVDSTWYMWLSVDPLADQNIQNSPYMYCNGNPIMMIDSDGRDAILITFPDYKATYRGYKIPFTGHSGILLIDNKTGVTKYYEYGRYDREELGVTRNIKIPNVIIQDGKPTLESINTVMQAISRSSGNNGNIEGAYIVSNDFSSMNAFAKEKMRKNDDPGRIPYQILTNNCATFAEDIISQDTEVQTPWILIHTPINVVKEYQKFGNSKISYDSKQNQTTWYLEEE